VETKSAKLNRETIVSAELLTKKLSAIEGLSMKKMFGGHGVFHDQKIFGIADSKGNYFFKANEINKADFE
jgi:DNA transformation protein